MIFGDHVIETKDAFDKQPKTDAECKAEVDRMLVEIQRMLTEMSDPDARRKHEAIHAEIETSLADIRQTLAAIETR